MFRVAAVTRRDVPGRVRSDENGTSDSISAENVAGASPSRSRPAIVARPRTPMDSARVTDGPTVRHEADGDARCRGVAPVGQRERRIEEAAARRSLGEVGAMEAARVRAVQALLEVGEAVAVGIGRGIVLARD